MLVLTRKIGESIRIGDDVTVTVLGDSGRPVRLGIDAPGEVTVHREEVYRRVRGGRPGSPQSSPAPLRQRLR